MPRYIIAFGPSIHLGVIKESFGRGSVITHDEEQGRLTIDGRKFESDRDMDVLQRQAATHPDKPWIVPYSEEAFARLSRSVPVPQEVQPGKAQKMEVVKSDEDSHPEIDITDTQVSKAVQATKEAEREKTRNRDVEGELPVVRGDETPEEVRERQAREMPIVKDDGGLGYGGGKYDALNAGQQTGGNREADEKAQEIANSRKKEADRVRAASDDSPVSSTSESQTGTPDDSFMNLAHVLQAGRRISFLEMEVADLRADMGKIITILENGHPRVPVVESQD